MLKKLVQVEWCILLFLSINSNFSWHSAWDRIIRLHDFRLNSEIEVVILANSWSNSLKFFKGFPLLLLTIAIHFGLLGKTNGFGDLLSLLSTDVKTFIWACDGGVMIYRRIIGIDDLWVDTSLLVGADGAVIHLDIQTIKIKNVWKSKKLYFLLNWFQI